LASVNISSTTLARLENGTVWGAVMINYSFQLKMLCGSMTRKCGDRFSEDHAQTGRESWSLIQR
jgi:hypothetical protein